MYGARDAWHTGLLCGLSCFLLASGASAQERILLQEVLPALQETELGHIELGRAPPPGTGRVVRRSEVLAALRDAGHEVRGLAIPAATRIERRARVLDRDAFAELARTRIVHALTPCRVETLHSPATITLPEGPASVRVDISPVRRTGSMTAVVIVDVAGRETRVPVRVDVTCPAPTVQPGNQVRIVVAVGNVLATAPGEVRQSGYAGENIRVTNRLTRRTILARVVDGETVRLLR